MFCIFFFFFQAEDGIRDGTVTGVQTCALPIWAAPNAHWTWTRRRRGLTVRTSFRTLLNWDLSRQVCDEVMRFEVTEAGARRVFTQRHQTRIVFPQELCALVALAGGYEFCGWFSNFSLRRPLER